MGNRLLVCALAVTLLPACQETGSDSAMPESSADSIASLADQTPSDTEGPQAAAAVVREYYAAIDAGDHRRAYLLWGDSGRASGQTLQEFRAGFAGTRSVTAHVGEPGRIEGAAGSRYVEIPVRVEAETTSDSIQRFVGSYVLRRAVVEGATPAQRRWHIHSAEISACSGGCPPASAASTGARDVVRRFGERLRMVSVLAPGETVARSIREQYGPLITRELLERWISDPASAPGRRVSNPWPRSIEIGDVRAEGENARVVTGEVMYVTSGDTTRVVDEERVMIRVVRGEDGRWRIGGYAPA